MSARPKKDFSVDTLEQLKISIKTFSKDWPEKPEATKGKKQSVHTAILEMSNEIKLLVKNGYTAADIADGLKANKIDISISTLKAYISEIMKAEKEQNRDKTVLPKTKQKKTRATKCDGPQNAVSTHIETAKITTKSKKTTKGALAVDADEY